MRDAMAKLRSEIASPPEGTLREVAGLPTVSEGQALWTLLDRNVWAHDLIASAA